jgi:hypothetical protein
MFLHSLPLIVKIVRKCCNVSPGLGVGRHDTYVCTMWNMHMRLSTRNPLRGTGSHTRMCRIISERKKDDDDDNINNNNVNNNNNNNNNNNTNRVAHVQCSADDDDENVYIKWITKTILPNVHHIIILYCCIKRRPPHEFVVYYDHNALVLCERCIRDDDDGTIIESFYSLRFYIRKYTYLFIIIFIVRFPSSGDLTPSERHHFFSIITVHSYVECPTKTYEHCQHNRTLRCS